MLSLWNLYPLLLDFVVKVKVNTARLNATVNVVVEEKQQLGQDPTFSIDNSCNTLPSIPRGRDTWWDEKAPSSLEVHQIGWPTWKGRVERESERTPEMDSNQSGAVGGIILGVFQGSLAHLGASRRLRGQRYIEARFILGHILTFFDPPCQPGQIFLVQNSLYRCPTYSTTCGQKFQKVENDENRFYAITSSKLFKNWFCRGHIFSNNIFHNHCFLYVL